MKSRVISFLASRTTHRSYRSNEQVSDVISCLSPNTPLVLADNASRLTEQFDSPTDQLHST